ncbi:hypothetical protein Salmuc_03375 [Salipiger mucosus DSM 16094]|uniref:Uncharacterized protein n=1 Tax=Salipiger mucosus DSM 16094 TaxID=1123237 RepID=S9QES0_9RHOB|nr:hypothetical protein Salmuc_03375 [Salipiger mucosus DSM 16094]
MLRALGEEVTEIDLGRGVIENIGVAAQDCADIRGRKTVG